MKLRKSSLERLTREASTYNHWVDYLNIIVNTELMFWERYTLLNTTNTNDSYIDWELFTYTLTKDTKKKQSTLWVNISINDIPYGIIKITDYREWWCMEHMYSISILWTCFRLIEMWEIESLNDLLIDIFDEYDCEQIDWSYINRMDYKTDLLFDKEWRKAPRISTLVQCREDAKTQDFSISEKDHHDYLRAVTAIRNWQALSMNNITKMSEWNYCTWRRVWTKKNKSMMIRLYEKKRDSVSKGKYWLYGDYFNYWTVWRVECEFQDFFCRREDKNRYTYWTLSELIDKAQSFFGLGKKRLKQSYLYRPNPNLKKIDLKYKKNYCKRWERILNNTENPYIIQSKHLLDKWYSKLKLCKLSYQNYLFWKEKIETKW